MKTDAEINRWLAEKLEPMPIYWEPDGSNVYLKSRFKCWWRGNGYGQTPSDFFADWNMTGLLMEKLIKDLWMSEAFHRIHSVAQVLVGGCGNPDKCKEMESLVLQRAVALAAFKSLGGEDV